jgi:SAM-dependent methyltransferase
MNCRSCGGSTVPLLDLGKQPLANHLLNSSDDTYDLYPLRMVLCESCHLGQLADVVPPEAMFREYAYYTSISGPSVESARELVKSIHVPEGGSVVEIGSNDGYLLQFYKERGISVLGIDPASGPSQIAHDRGIATLKEFFTADLARRIPQVDVIHANNVLAHVPDLNDFVAGLAILLKPNGSCFIEVPYLENLLKHCQFDTIYHEHYYYFSFQSLRDLFERHGLHVVYVQHFAAHGGSLRLRIGHIGTGFTMHENLEKYYDTMQERMVDIAINLRTALSFLRGKRVWGFAAAAKATVMMNYCGLEGLIEAVADDTPAKIGKYIPGTGTSIISTQSWLAVQPKYTCIFAWNYAPLIMSRYTDSYHGTFFTPYNLESLKEHVK